MSESDLNTQLLARLLGETYRVQKHLNMPVPVDDGTIYGLLHGVEEALDKVQGDRWYDNDRFRKAAAVLSDIFDDREKLAAFKGFYDLEHEWQQAGLDRADAIVFLTYLYNSRRFSELIEKMKSDHSPIECKSFDLSVFDK